MSTTPRRRPQQCLATTIRKVEPMGAGMVRMYFAVEQAGGWEDRAVIEMPCCSIPSNFAFALSAVKAIERELEDEPRSGLQLVPHLGTVN
ncbi:hypothetical protein CK489_28730 [Bradyrhizobium sp. UFLA03-84]|uniref:hypothetical protein n=1 Tax=Bradyrhizobium sp. UFLA03-84 TaxID=418599 RepID=UPI000BAE5A0F|nr:hypothetical protein [Bradyrhizobium sp. UFLA03-84]PAY05378.1 hypothetical protein CK489_28730 [Bradyrhizobium sp. UFLA03-84]